MRRFPIYFGRSGGHAAMAGDDEQVVGEAVDVGHGFGGDADAGFGEGKDAAFGPAAYGAGYVCLGG